LSPRPILTFRSRQSRRVSGDVRPTTSCEGQNLTVNSDAKLRQAAMFGAPYRGKLCGKYCRIAVKEFK
jgi:hypothetical protein